MNLRLKDGWTFNQRRTRKLLEQSGTACRFSSKDPQKLWLNATPKAHEYYPGPRQWMLNLKACVITPDGVERDINLVQSLHGKMPSTW